MPLLLHTWNEMAKASGVSDIATCILYLLFEKVKCRFFVFAQKSDYFSGLSKIRSAVDVRPPVYGAQDVYSEARQRAKV